MSARFSEIEAKVARQERLSREDGLFLFKEAEEAPLLALADANRKARVGDTVYYASTLYIHPTNLCELSCPMCSFYAKPGMAKAWFMKPEEVEAKVRASRPETLTEVHVVGGLWRDCNLDYYQDIFTRIKNVRSDLHIKALTPVEYDFLAKLHGISVEEVFTRMMSWGLGSLPGGGAEILVEKIRKQLAPQKITSQEYMDIHEKAHNLGLRSNITMLFGHVEDPEDIIAHLDWVRTLQDETGGFQTFVPLKYHIENNALGRRSARLKKYDLKRVYAISRLMLDNVHNIKVLWNYLGVDLAKQILQCGGNDFSATQQEEQIIKMAGGVDQTMTTQIIEEAITSLGRKPHRIHSGHQYEHKGEPACSFA